jgi:hypothetical protein
MTAAALAGYMLVSHIMARGEALGLPISVV